MKRLFTLLFAVVMIAMSAMATDYTDDIVVTVNGNASKPQTTTISVNKETDGKYTFNVKSFSFGGQKIGDVVLTDVEGKEEGDIVVFESKKYHAKIENPGAGIGWLLYLSGIDVTITAKMATTKLYANLDMEYAKQNINAKFGDEKNITTSINAPQSAINKTTTTIYTLDGQQVSNMTSGQVYIVKTTDGKTKKVIKK